jgi:hypothetical protein
MNCKLNVIISRTLRRWLAPSLAATLLVIAAPVFAHGGFDHVMGTVAKLTGNVLTVTTAKGRVDIKMDDKTELTKDNHKAGLTDLTPGTRVLVDIPEGSKDRIAHSLKIGAAAAGHDARQ